MLDTMTHPPNERRRGKKTKYAENFLNLGKMRRTSTIRTDNAPNLVTKINATIPGNWKPKSSPTRGRRNVKELEGILTVFTKSNR